MLDLKTIYLERLKITRLGKIYLMTEKLLPKLSTELRARAFKDAFAQAKKFEWSAPLDTTFWLAGGALRSLLDPDQSVSDYDLFFKNVQAAEMMGEILEKQYKFKLIFKCPKGELRTYKKHDIKIQLITKSSYKSVDDLLSSFDFTICMAAIEFNGSPRKLHFTCLWVDDVKKKHLRFHRITYPVATMNRMYKYREKGYFMPQSEYVSFIMDVQLKEFNNEELVLYVD